MATAAWSPGVPVEISGKPGHVVSDHGQRVLVRYLDGAVKEVGRVKVRFRQEPKMEESGV